MIKIKSSLLISILSMISLISCSSSTSTSNDNTNTTTSSNSSNSTTSTINTTTNNKSIVVYFSRTNNTKKIASYFKELTFSDSYEILAKVPYTDEDIDYTNSSSRANKEQADSSSRPEIGSEKIDLSKYNDMYLGYPIWHSKAPKIMYTFVESYDLTNITIIPFCTSHSSGIGSSATNLAKANTKAKFLEGKRFSQSASKDEVKSFIDNLKR